MNEATIFTIVYVAGFAITIGALLIAWVLRHKRWLTIPLMIIAVLCVVIGMYFLWYTHRPLPTSEQRTLFPGITYTREVRTDPVAMMISVVEIDLTTPGLSFFVTPQGEHIPARTTSQFLAEFDLQLAINGDFFDPWRDYGFWDYYPHVGDQVIVRGLTASNGEIVTRGYAPPENYVTLYLDPDNHISFNEPPAEIAQAISGNIMVTFNGEPMYHAGNDSYLNQRHPRTAIGVDEAGQTMLLILVDGRQPSYSEGATLPELAAIALQYGAYHAINLDGGGSTTLVVEDANGVPQVLNSPIHNRIPGRERPIANHFGIYVTNSN